MIFILHNQWLLTILCHFGKIENYNCHCGKNSGEQKIKEKLMKKVLKIGVVLTTLVFGLVCLAACSDGEESRSVVAEWKSKDNLYSYKFYSDGTYDWLSKAQVYEKGSYYSTSSPRQQGTITISQEYDYDENTGTLIPYSNRYDIEIYRDDGELYLYDSLSEYYLID